MILDFLCVSETAAQAALRFEIMASVTSQTISLAEF